MLTLAAILVFLLTKIGNCYQTVDGTGGPSDQNNSYWQSGQSNINTNQSIQAKNDSNKSHSGTDFIKKESRNSEVFVAGRGDGYRTTFTTYETKGFYAQSGFGNSSGTDRQPNYNLKPNPTNYTPTKAVGGIPVPYGRDFAADKYKHFGPGSQSNQSDSSHNVYYAAARPSIGGQPVAITTQHNPFGSGTYGNNYFATNNNNGIHQPGLTNQQYGSSSAAYHAQARPAIGGKPVPGVGYPDSDPFLYEKLVADPGLSTRIGLNGPGDWDGDDNTEYEESERQSWQVSVFSKEVTPYVRVCGGSLVTSTAVISAAHCYWGVGPLPATQFVVGARDALRHESPTTEDYVNYVHLSDVRAIHIPPRYRSVLSNVQGDIAVLIVEKPFPGHLKPVCVSFGGALEERQLSDGSLGTILASGIMKNTNQSTILRNIKVPLISVEECMRLMPEQLLKFLTSDKICAGATQPRNASLCLEEAGSGLAFPLAAVPFLRAVASPAPAACADARAYTLLRAHAGFLRRHAPGLEGACAETYPQLHALLGGDSGPDDDGDGDVEEDAQFVCNCYC